LELAYFSGYTHVEIAGLLDVPLWTVKVRMRLDLKKIRDYFAYPKLPRRRKAMLSGKEGVLSHHGREDAWLPGREQEGSSGRCGPRKRVLKDETSSGTFSGGALARLDSSQKWARQKRLSGRTSI
jgi:hypothetical protein